MPNPYTENPTTSTNTSDSFTSVPTQNSLPQTWTGTGNGAQIKMYNVNDFHQQQQAVNAQITATDTTNQADTWAWNSSDPWSWGAPQNDPSQWPKETEQMNNVHGTADGASNTIQHAGMFNPQDYFNQDSSWTKQSWQSENYYHAYAPNGATQHQTLHQQQSLQQQPIPFQEQPIPFQEQPIPFQEQPIPFQEQPQPEQQLHQPQSLPQHIQHEEQIQTQEVRQEHHMAPPPQLLQPNQMYKPSLPPSTINNNNNNEKSLNLPITTLAAQTPHLFQRSDSWLSSSSLLTINDSLCTSQDTLDASHFMPAETLDEIRKQVSEMEIKDPEDADPNVTNQEIPTKIPTESDDDKIRQPPEGAANKSPVGMIAVPPSGKTMQRPAAGTATVTATQADITNDETLRPDNANASDAMAFRFSVQSGFSPREDSPFKPPPKSAASIPAVIQQERIVDHVEESARQEVDDGFNLEMMPDNSEQLPIDSSIAAIERKASDSPSVPASASLWNDPDIKQQTIFLAPPSTSSPMQTQNVLIVPRLEEQQQLLNSSLSVLASQERGQENIENFSQFVNPEKPKVEKTLEMLTESKPDLVDNTPKVTVEELRADTNRGQRPLIPGLGPVQLPRSEPPRSEPPRSEAPRSEPPRSEPPRRGEDEREWAPKKVETWNRRDWENDKSDTRHRSIREGENQKERGPYSDNPDLRQQKDFIDDRKNYYSQRSDSRQGHEHSDERRRGYPDEPKRDLHDDRRRDYPDYVDDRRRDYPDYPDERRGSFSDDPRNYRGRRYGYDDRSRYYDDPYYQERDRSRPSSRPLMEDDRELDRSRKGFDERPSSRSGGYDERDYYERGRRGVEERPSSRSGYESDRENSKGNSYGYSRDEYYRRDPRYNRGGDTAYMSERDRYYQQYYNSYYYNNYSYGYYDELYRTDPRFRAQVEAQYRDYYASHYAGYESSSDQRSIQSGRSSVNDDIQREREKLELRDNSLNQSYSEYNQSNESYYQNLYTKAVEVATPAVRLTPSKFMVPHIKVQLTANGHLVRVLANNPNDGQPAVVEISDLQMLFENNVELEEMKKFPGPLIKGETHKNDVIQFCKDKIIMAEKDMGIIDKSSYILIWELLILLIRQNGTVVGTDIAELLMKDVQKAETTSEITSADTSSNSELTTPDEGIVVSDRSVISHFSEETVTKKFREYLLSGRKKEALEKAMKNGLWGHALFLASKMDSRTYANVMTRFANSLALNDPLQTLYQLMSGRQPAAVTCIAEEKWGDWRPHLAMILSNPTQKPNLDRKSITTMGDTLATRGLLHASQFCYLMAQMDFGTYASKSSKLVLLGANHGLPFAQFATNEAIQCTEVYEFAQQLASPNFIIPTFQFYRFLYATRLVEYGMPQECLRYCEVLAESISKFPSIFNPDLLTPIFELANKLKYYDQSYNEIDDMTEAGDPAWLIKLKNVLNGYNSEIIQQAPEEISYNYASESSNASENGEPQQQLQQQQQLHPNAFSQTTATTNYYNPSVAVVDSSPSYIGYQQNQQQQYVPHDTEPIPFSYTTAPGQVYQQDYSQGTGDMYSGSYYPQDPNSSLADNSYQNTDVSTSAGQFSDYWDISTKKETPPSSPIKSTADVNASQMKNVKAKSTQEPKHKPPSGSSASSGSSWLGGIFSKFMPKPKNQMKLPDDRNPKIVWDPVAKKWMNTEAEEDEITNTPIAPPKDEDISGRRQSIPSQNETSTLNSPLITSNSLPPPSMASDFNRFRRQGTQKRYVDVIGTDTKFKAQTSNLPTHLFPEQQITNQTTPQLFIPSAVSSDAITDQSEFASYTQQVPSTGSISQPLLEDDGDLSRSSSQGSLGREVQHYMAPQIQMTEVSPPAAVQQPLLFNPNLVPTTTTMAPVRGPRRYPR